MLLTDVQLKNFMKHEAIDISLDSGMNILRGSNEAGKSSVLTGIAYNWFGASALPQSVADTITWGAKKSSMKTTTKFQINGFANYICHRSASGAELYRDDETHPLVTGHKEVSEAVANLFDLPSVSAATKLQIATQNDVRGVISLGATAAAAFIEELIDMQEIDAMIKDVSERLTYSGDAKKQAIASADAAAEALSSLGKPVNTKKLANALDKAAVAVTAATEQVDAAQGEATETELALRQRVSEVESSAVQIRNLKNKLASVKEHLRLPAGDDISEEDIAEASRLLHANTRYNFYKQEFIPFVGSSPAEVWEGTKASLDLYIQGLQDTKATHVASLNALKEDLARTEGMIIKDTVCPTCGQDIQDKEAVEERNKTLGVKRDALRLDIGKENDAILEVMASLRETDVILAFQHKQELWVMKNADWLEVNDKVIPNELFMAGGNPSEPLKKITQVEFNQLCQTHEWQAEVIAAYDRNTALCTELENEIDLADQNRLDLSSTLDGLTAARDEAAAALRLAREDLNVANSSHAKAHTELTLTVAENDALEAQRTRLTSEVKKFRDLAEEIQSNGDLISALRSARLEVSSLLWRKLLGVTETYFSLFRGVPSTLDMSKKGILVDGHLSAPSGSTLDILGLALRLAMSKLFANNGLCILDEPSAGCDDERTAAMTAGLLSSGFDQVILVTHKDVDESAGHLIEL